MEKQTAIKSPAAMTALKGAAAADASLLVLNAIQTALISSGKVSMDLTQWISTAGLGLCSALSGFITAGKVGKARLPWALVSGLMASLLLVLAGCVFFPDFALSRCLGVIFPAVAGSAAGGVAAAGAMKKK